jgi:hypothetical protein
MLDLMRKIAVVSAVIAGMCVPVSAQHAAEPSARYYRLICLVHLTGAGNLAASAVRPEYVPTAIDVKRQGIIAWGMQLTDDKSMAIVHLVASNRAAFAAILADTRPEIRVFEIGKNSRAQIEAEMQKYKKGFDLSKFEVRAQ